MKVILIVAVFALLVLTALISLFIGATSISAQSAFREFVLGAAGELSVSERNILLEIRLPRLLAAVLVGGSLGIAGVAFQGLFRNPLAEPYIIGASSGAALGVTIVIVLGWNVVWLGLQPASFGALVGSIALVGVVLLFGSLSPRSNSLTLLLAGVAISSMINSLVSLLMFLNDDKVFAIVAWLMGSLAVSDWSSVRTTAILSVTGFVILLALSRPLDAYLLGDAATKSLGVNLVSLRLLLVVGAGIATAGAVAAGGVIGFVGLIAPHVARRLVGPVHWRLIPMSACIGALVLVEADTLARTIVAPTELPVGVITALLGCPMFLVLLVIQSRRGGFSGGAP